MSATNRGERGGEGVDFFGTPAWCVDWLLRVVDLPGGYWLEPSAGDGAIIRAVNARREDVRWGAVELRAEMAPRLGTRDRVDERWIGDLRHWAAWIHEHRRFAAVIGNVPYALAEEHLGFVLPMAPVTAMLLRLNFLGSQRRRDFWRRHPADVYVLSERPSFGVHVKCAGVEDVDGEMTRPACGWSTWLPAGSRGPRRCPTCGAPTDASGSDATEYAWFVWGQCGSGPGRIQVLGPPETESLGL